MAAGTISTRLAEWLLVALIVFSLIFEALLHRLEHWINHKHQHLQAVTRVLYRELMVLGLVSFIFILYETIAKPTGDTVLSFEFAHVFIFLLAIFYTIVLIVAMVTSLRLSKRWKEMEQVDLVRYLHLKEKYTQFRHRIHEHKGSYWQLFHWWFPNIKNLFRYWDLHELMAFHDIRFQVIYYRNLPEHFRFASFLRKIKSASFLELVETHWSLYAILLVLVLADILRRYLTRSDIDTPVKAAAKVVMRAAVDKKDLPPYEPDNAESAFIIVSAVLLGIFCQVLSSKIRKIYWELTKHPRVYYNNVEPAVLTEELHNAVEQRREAERSRRRSLSMFMDETGELADDEGVYGKAQGADSLVTKGKDTEAGKAHDADGAMSEISAADTHASERGTLKYSALRAEGFRKTSSMRSMDAINSSDRFAQAPSRSSVELRRPVRSDLSANMASESDSQLYVDQRSVNAGERKNGVPRAADNLPAELQETARRHSLDLTRAPAVAPGVVKSPLATAPGMQPSSVAMAAVSAARRRSLEGNPALPQRSSVEYTGGDNGRSSVDMDRDDGNGRRSINSPRVLSHLSSKRGSVDDDTSRTTLGFRNSLDTGRRRSIELAIAMPHDELAERHHASSVDISDRERDRDVEAGVSSDGGVAMRNSGLPDRQDERSQWARVKQAASSKDRNESGTSQDEEESAASSRQQKSFFRQKSLALLNATILRNLELEERARNTEPAYYPWVIRKLFPRVTRVASPIEKLFWFGSHKFYMWCVEFTMFFSTVLLAAAFASLSLLLLYDREINAANIVSFVLPPLTLMFVLLRIAGIMKKYIFIIHNASLVPEAIAIEAIHSATQKGPVVAAYELSDDSGDETDLEQREAAAEKRRKLGRYFRSEAEIGNVMGIEAEDAIRTSDAASASARRARKRSLLLKLRSRRTDAFGEKGVEAV